jgi:hypothetical protein
MATMPVHSAENQKTTMLFHPAKNSIATMLLHSATMLLHSAKSQTAMMCDKTPTTRQNTWLRTENDKNKKQG